MDFIFNIVIFHKKIIILFLLIYYNIFIYNISFIYPNYTSNYNFIFHQNKVIKIGIYAVSIKGGGLQRFTSLFINYFYKIKIFKLYFYTIKSKQTLEFNIPKNINRILITKHNLIKAILSNKIDIFIYQYVSSKIIQKLNNLKDIKTIFYNHHCIFTWIYSSTYSIFKTFYKAYQKSKYIISLIPFENDYLFKKWKINSILMNNFIAYDYNSVKPSDLLSQIIIMIGRGNDKWKRFDLGIKAMKYIVEEIPGSEMKIIANNNNINGLKKLTKYLKLENHIKYSGYIINLEKYYKNASLHILPSICESFGYSLAETKIFGIPSILVGIDYVSIAKRGTIIIYNDSPESIAKEAIIILSNYKYRKKLGIEARKSMKIFNNDLLLRKWVKLIISIYKGGNYYQWLIKNDNKISYKNAQEILNKQINLLRIRNKKFKNFTIKDIENITFMQNLNINLKI